MKRASPSRSRQLSRASLNCWAEAPPPRAHRVGLGAQLVERLGVGTGVLGLQQEELLALDPPGGLQRLQVVGDGFLVGVQPGGELGVEKSIA